jgi:hypothetical protein
MDSELPSRLFVSYSHTDMPEMLIFQKHLRGMLLNKTQVWSDRDISKGSHWDFLLKGNLKPANSALLLATPDYLISSWCRDELQRLSAAKRAGTLRGAFSPLGHAHMCDLCTSKRHQYEYPLPQGRACLTNTVAAEPCLG